MSDLTSLDPQTLAGQMAGYDILAMQTALKSQSASLAAQKNALTALRTALTDFRTSINALNATGSSVLKNSATVNQEGVATVTANASARKGTYNLNIQQLATAEQIGYNSLSDDDIRNATGSMTITINGESVDIDMDGLESLSDFASAVNAHDDNPGVTASLVRSGGEVMLMLSSDETGVENTFALDTSGLSNPDMFSDREEISTAQDALFTLGNSTVVRSSSSNTLDDLVEGVSIQLTGTTEAGKPLIVNVDTDTSGTQEQVQAFVDAYNTLRGTLKTLTDSGASGGNRGAFAGDAGIASLENELNNMLRTSFGGNNMTDFGLTTDREGKLTLNSEKLNEQLKKDPQSVDAFFNGDGGIIKSMDKSLDKYLNSTTGLLKGRQETLDRKQSDIDTKTEKMNTRYETSYNRYLRQFTQLQQIMVQMNSTMSMFGLV